MGEIGTKEVPEFALNQFQNFILKFIFALNPTNLLPSLPKEKRVDWAGSVDIPAIVTHPCISVWR